MKIIDLGHDYALDHLDGIGSMGMCSVERLRFVKREGPGYPGNVGSHAGTNIQEVLRVLIDRVKYLDSQVPCSENKQILAFLRQSIFLLERRAAKRHNRFFDFHYGGPGIEDEPTCPKCGHIGCGGECREAAR
jgi:hypothetical protein